MLTPDVFLAVLTWDGEVSAVSKDAAEDSRLARARSVLDDWDEQFDRGKVCSQPGTQGLGGRPGLAGDGPGCGSLLSLPGSTLP